MVNRIETTGKPVLWWIGTAFMAMVLIWTLQSCQQDETEVIPEQAAGMLKSASAFDLPIYMDKNVPAGSAVITHDPVNNLVKVTAVLHDDLLSAGWEVSTAHLYAAELPPPSNAPGLFPYKSNAYPVVFEVAGPAWDCPGFTWNFALHLELRKRADDQSGSTGYTYESAWLLPEVGGTNWNNKGKGNAKGWGEYFSWTFDYTPELSNIGLHYSKDLSFGSSAGGDATSGFSITMDGSDDFYYLDADLESSLPLAELSGFYLDEVTDPAFTAYWSAKLGDPANAAWAPVMQKILDGELPLFFLKSEGDDHSLVDGLQYALSSGTVQNPLRLNGNYPEGTYSFTGDVQGLYCALEDFTISLTVTLTSGVMTDSRDGNNYKWVRIGDQVWMSQNLAYLPSVSPSSAGSATEPYFYVYGYNGTSVSEAKATSNYAVYGALYNWAAVVDGGAGNDSDPSGIQSVCPDGWHMPSDEEWKQMEMFLGLTREQADGAIGIIRGTDQGARVKSVTGWLNDNTGTNTTGFTGLPAGYRTNTGNFFGMGSFANFWSATAASDANAWTRRLINTSILIGRGPIPKVFGFSVRCVRD